MNASPNSQDLMMEYELIRQDISSIDEQIRQLQEHHASLIASREAIDSLKDGSGRELFVPSGSGVYFNAVINSSDSFLVNVGANVLIEMGRVHAIETIDERVEQALSMIVRLNEEADALVNRVKQIESVLSSGQ
ncbi:MAG TPA: prefoldin subunit alpha [Candidatus Nanoarchaeia archaeon]|nr:prefoldin subunit alpha [Candidatus Nanoarchaeia archaeon]